MDIMSLAALSFLVTTLETWVPALGDTDRWQPVGNPLAGYSLGTAMSAPSTSASMSSTSIGFTR